MSNYVLSAFADEISPDLSVQIETLKYYNISHIEMRGVNGKNLSDYTIEEAQQIKNELDKNGFKLSAIGSPIGKVNINDDLEEHYKKFLHVLELAKLMESKYIRIFSFFMPEGEDPWNYTDKVIEQMVRMTKAAGESGIILLHENEKDIYGDTAERCLKILETVNSPFLKGIFDFANFVQCRVETYPHAYNMLKDHIRYIHVKDAIWETGEVVPPGDGDGKITEIIKELELSGYNGFLTLEPHLSNFTGFASLEGDAEASNKPTGRDAELFDIAYNGLYKILKENTSF